MKKQTEAKMIIFEDINGATIGINLNKVIEFEIEKRADDEGFEFELLMDVQSFDDSTTNAFFLITEKTRDDITQQIKTMMRV